MDEKGGKTLGKRFDGVSRSRTFRRIVQTLGLGDRAVLDLGCGYGEYLAYFGPGSNGITTTPEEVRVGTERGLKITLGNVEEIDTLGLPTFSAIWANNLFEHLLAPHAFLIRLRTVAKPQAMLILGVPMVPRIVSLTLFKKFRGVLATNHINFFTRDTLRLTVERAGWKVREIRPFVTGVAVVDRLLASFAPHLYVVADLDKEFSYPVKKLKEWESEPYYKDILTIVEQKHGNAL